MRVVVLVVVVVAAVLLLVTGVKQHQLLGLRLSLEFDNKPSNQQKFLNLILHFFHFLSTSPLPFSTPPISFNFR